MKEAHSTNYPDRNPDKLSGFAAMLMPNTTIWPKIVPSGAIQPDEPQNQGIATKKRQRIGVTLFPKSPLSRASISKLNSLMRGCKFNYGGYTGQNTQLELRAPGPYS